MHNYISISTLSEWFYCPRSCFYLLSDFSPHQEYNYFILDGRNKHFKSSIQRSFRNRVGEQVISQVLVSSHKKKIVGKIDRLEVIDDKTVKIIEEKRGKVRSDNKIEWQVKLLVFSYQEMFPEKTVLASIYFIDSRRHRVVNFNLKEIGEEIDNIKGELFSGKAPVAKRDARCFGCMYQKICG